MAYDAGQAFIQIVPSFQGVVQTISAEAAKWGDSAGQAFGDTFKARVDAAIAKLPNAKVGADTSEADAKIAAIRAELEDLSSERIGIDISEADATAKLETIRVELDELGASSPDIKVKVDAASAELDLAAVDAESHAVSDGLKDVGNSSGGAGGGLSSLAESASSAIPALSATTAGIAALGLALIPIGGLVAGALSTLPSLLAGAASGIGALKLGLSGIGGAISEYGKIGTTPTSSGGSGNSAAIQAITNAEEERNATESVANATRELAAAKTNSAGAIAAAEQKVQSAEDSLTQAILNEGHAQTALTQARQDAQDQLTSYSDQLADGALQAKENAFALAEAQATLASDQKSGANPTTLYGDQLAVQQAQQAIQDQSDQYAILQRNAAAAQAAGVDGAPQVVAAQVSVANAVAGVSDAQEAVRSANDDVTKAQVTGAQNVALAEKAVTIALQNQSDTIKRISLELSAGTNGITTESPAAKYAADLAKLTPAGRAFVEYVTGTIEPKIHTLTDETQSALLPGLLTGLQDLQPLFTDLSPYLLDAATDIGNFAIGLGNVLGSKQGMSELNGIFSAGDGFMKSLGGDVEKLVGAFLKIGNQAQPIVKKLGDGISDLVGDFAKWVDHGGFENFLTWLKDNGPGIVTDIKNFGSAMSDLITDATPLGKLLLDIAGDLASMLKDIQKSDPWVVTIGIDLGAVALALKGMTTSMAFLTGEKGFASLGSGMLGAVPAVTKLGGLLAGLSTSLTGIGIGLAAAAGANAVTNPDESDQQSGAVQRAEYDVDHLKKKAPSSVTTTSQMIAYLKANGITIDPDDSGKPADPNEWLQLAQYALTHRAGGGPVDVGLAYLVGEKGPEMFVPNQSGQVISSAALTAAINGGNNGRGAPAVVVEQFNAYDEADLDGFSRMMSFRVVAGQL